MSTGSSFTSDLPAIHNIVQASMLSYPKQLIIAMIREYFSEDSLYHYVRDPFGYPLNPDHTDLPIESGINNDASSRIFIGEKWREEGIFYPAVLVSSGGMRSVPISFNRERGSVQWETMRFIDGYGNSTEYSTPSNFILAGANEGSVNIDILSRGVRERDDIADYIYMLFVDLKHDEAAKSGVVIKSGSPSIGAPTESEDRNSKLYRLTVTLDIRTEWRRAIPVKNIIDAINICVDFGNLSVTPPKLAPNLEINGQIDLLGELQKI